MFTSNKKHRSAERKLIEQKQSTCASLPASLTRYVTVRRGSSLPPDLPPVVTCGNKEM